MKTLHTIYTIFAKRFAVVLALLLALGVTSVWGETVTFVPSDFSGQGTANTGSEMSSTKNGVTFSCDKGFGTTQIRCYKGSTITINSSNIITDISFTFSENDYNGDLSTTTTALYSGLNTNNWTQKLSAEQARITQCVITYTIPGASTPDPEPDPTTTYSINWHTSTSTCISNTVTANSIIQKPETDPTMDGYTFRGWTDQCEIASNGSNFSPITNFGVAQADKDYYAVFAIKTEGGSDVIDIIDNNVTKNKLGSTGTSTWVGLWQTETLASGAKYSIRSMGINNATDYALQWNANAYLYTSSKPQEGLKLKSLTVKTQDSESIKLFGSTSIYTELASTTALATLSTNSDGATYSLTPEQLANNYTCIGINGNSSSTKVISISITYSAAASYDEYITTCTNEVIVTLDPNGGTGNFTGWDEDDDNYTKTVEKENSVTLPNILEKTGYTFQGWSDGENTYTGQYAPTANVTLTASWKAIDYDITYNLYGGTNHASNPAKYTIETSIITLQAPTKTGYTFGGWYKEDAFTNPVTQITKGSIGNITLYAKWTPNTYTVQFNANGGTGTMGSQSFTYDAEPTALSANIFERVGYNFNSWNTAKDGTGEPYDDKAEVQNLTAAANGVVTLYAQWTAKKLINYRTLCTYEITYEETYGVDHDNSDTYTVADLPLEFEAPTSTREGYTFAGWNPAILSAETRGDLTVTALWQVNSHTLTWNVNGGDELTGEYTTGSVEYGTTIIPPANPTRTGYTFAGWGAEVAQTMPDHDLVYTAQWTVNTYSITLNQQGGTGGSESIEVTYDAELPAITIPTREGYTFGGYFTSENGEGTQYYNQEGTAYYNKKCDIASATTLYAKWTPHKFTVKFNANGGDGSMEDQQFTYDIEQALSANQFTRVGYSFAGWNDKTDGSGTSYLDQQVVKNLTATKDGQKTLYAQWAAIHTVTWMVNGSQAEGDPTTSVVNGQTITTLPTTPDVDCNGKVFVGWTTATIHGETATMPDPLYTELGAFPAVTSNMTFYAVFANGSGDERWVETEITKISSGDEVVISVIKYGSDDLPYTYALSHTNGTNNAPVASSLENIQNGILSQTPKQELVWTIEKDNANNLIFHPINDNTLNLYCNASDDGVRVGKSANALTNQKFIIYDNYLTNIATTRFVGVSFNTNPYTWRCYTNTTGVISDQILKFYKKITVYTSYTNYSTSCMAGVCDITNANPIYVTSAVGQKIKATEKLVLTTTDMAIGSEISLSAPNITFYKEDIEITQLTTSAASETFELEIAYQPTVAKTTEQPTITLEILGYQFAFNNKIIGRSLPETFAIVAKVGNMWYALPEVGYEAEKHATAYPVEVNDIADPTEVTSAVANNAAWSLRQVYQAQHSNAQHDRYVVSGANVVFENKQNPAKLLNASAQGDKGSNNYLLTSAQYDNYYSTNPGLYEWTPTTTDLETYTLTNVQRTDKQINISTNAVFGLHAADIVTNEVRFLPIQNPYTTLAAQVVEWKENSLLVMYNGDPAQTASVSVNGGTVQTATLSAVQKDIAVYELPATSLAANPGQMLKIAIGSEQLLLSIPYIISESKVDKNILPGSTVAERQEVAKVSDLVILKGGTLTADGAKTNSYKFRNVTIYGGGKLVVPAEKGFGVSTLTLRIGGVTEEGNYDYVYPEFELNINYTNAFTNTSAVINLDYVTTKDQYYTFVAPFAVETKDIKYPVDIYGSNVEAANRGSFEFQYYDGAARAAGEKGWKVVEEDPTEGATLTAHKGYTFYGMPKKVSVNGGTSTRQKFGIHRIPMSIGAAKVMEHENTEQATKVSAYPSQHNINAGWNLIGNPYMATITGLNNNSIQTGTIVLVDDRWQWSDAGSQASRFIVFPSNDGEWYDACQASNATLPAFKNFFVQIAGENVNALSIPFTHRAPSSISARRAAQDTEEDIELAIVLEKDAAHADQLDFLVNDAYTAVYDYNADFTKMMNNTQLNLFGLLMEDNLSFVAVDHLTAKTDLAIGYQVPQAGEYTLRLSEKPYVMWSRVDALYVTDHEVYPEVTTNLLEDDYTFQVGNAETNITRFTISIIPSKESSGTTTGVDNLLHHDMQTQKFIYNDQLYILRDGVVYDAMGQRIMTINK